MTNITARTAFQFQMKAMFNELVENESELNCGIFKALHASNECLFKLDTISDDEYRANREQINAMERKYQ